MPGLKINGGVERGKIVTPVSRVRCCMFLVINRCEFGRAALSPSQTC